MGDFKRKPTKINQTFTLTLEAVEWIRSKNNMSRVVNNLIMKAKHMDEAEQAALSATRPTTPSPAHAQVAGVEPGAS